MLISYNWLKEFFIQELPSPEAVADALTFHAFEIESIEQIGVDSIIDVDVLPNRAHDCLCHRGIAREVAAILELTLKNDPLREEAALLPETGGLAVSIDDPEKTSRYAAALVTGVSVAESPAWLKERLEALGQRSVNNIVDATNYVMFELGQPLHAFDFEKLGDDNGVRRIRVRNANADERITTLGGEEYKLSENIQLITDGVTDTPLAVAGIKGGTAAEVGEETSAVIIESAHFNAAVSRAASQELKLKTDASKRFENELSPELAGIGLARAAKLIAELSGGSIAGYVDAYPKPAQPRSTVATSKSAVNRLLGTAMTDADIEDALTRLDLPYTRDGETYTVTPPFERLDLERSEDLIEEIGRIHGYRAVPETTPERLPAGVHANTEYRAAEFVRSVLAQEGCIEISTYVFRERGKWELLNPSAKDKAFLRESLFDGLREAREQNVRRKDLLGLDAIRLFEIGAVFPEEGAESVEIGIALEQKKEVEPFLARLAEAFGYAPAAEVSDGIIRIPLADIIEHAAVENPRNPMIAPISYQPFSPYPFVLRDVAVWTPEGTSAEDVARLISEGCQESNADFGLARMRLFDEFAKDGRISYAYRLAFQSPERTLTDEEVSAAMAVIEAKLNAAEGFEVR